MNKGPNKVHSLILGSCDCATLPGKRNLTAAIKLRTPEHYPDYLSGFNVIMGVLHEGGRGSEGVVGDVLMEGGVGST